MMTSNEFLSREVSDILFRHDPIGINFEDNTDEYDPEARTIVDRLGTASSEADARRIVHEEFQRWFSESIAGPQERYLKPTAEIWSLWTENRRGQS